MQSTGFNSAAATKPAILFLFRRRATEGGSGGVKTGVSVTGALQDRRRNSRADEISVSAQVRIVKWVKIIYLR